MTSLIWTSAIAAMIDRRLVLSAAWPCLAAGSSAFGIIHSPLSGGQLVNPFQLPNLPLAAAGPTPLYLATTYRISALLLVVWGQMKQDPDVKPTIEETTP